MAAGPGRPKKGSFNSNEQAAAATTAAAVPATTVNRPRNFLVTDATRPFAFGFTGRGNIRREVVVEQTPDESTWPGGALWDLGVVLSELFAAAAQLIDRPRPRQQQQQQQQQQHSKSAPPSSNNGREEGTIEVTLTTTTTTATETTNESTKRGKKGGSGGGAKTKCSTRTIHLPDRVRGSEFLRQKLGHPSLVLELGCGVGLTGLAVAATARASPATATAASPCVVMTDLDIVVDRVTKRNVDLNTSPVASVARNNNRSPSVSPHRPRVINKGHVKVVAVPLCWANEDDERTVAELLKELDTASTCASPKSSCRKKKKNNKTQSMKDGCSSASKQLHHERSCAAASTGTSAPTVGIPDVVIIGDVAYQHRPGAPSHFDSLLLTLLKFTAANRTLVVFGTRIRMPASNDLLEMLMVHFDEVIVPPIRADEIDPSSFRNMKHNMKIHFLRRKNVCCLSGSGDVDDDVLPAAA